VLNGNILLVIFVSFGFAQQWFPLDDRVYHTIHDDIKCRFLDHVTDGVGVVSDIRTNLFAPVALYAFGKNREREAAKLALTGIALSVVTVFSLKTAINRQRPNDDSPRWDSSFPSGHTTLAFSTSIVYGNYYPKLRIPLLLYSTLVGLSRIYMGEHYPTDVLGGMVLGIGVGYIVMRLKKKILSFP
jgi:undecaprenyl-diphosphatase